MNKVIALIRIAGMVNRTHDISNTLHNLRLRKKYTCSIVLETKEVSGMVKKVRSFIAYGDIDKETLIELIKKRGKSLDKNKKIDVEKAADIILKTGNFDDTGLKPFFALHPPRKGINTKQHFPNGVLGNHKLEINNLIRRML